MTPTTTHFTIGQLAGAAGVNVETVRFYQRRGLLATPDRAYGAIRRYTAADLGRLHFVKSAQRLGFTLEQVAELLQLQDGTHCDEARQMAERKLADVRQRLDDLRRIEQALAVLVQRCACHEGDIACPLIEALQEG
ncbi:mercuric resistance operon regulatory protein [mine drainage metagenome]|jgi:MerR family mercuric resistance operon transcriptional regulator|uniref:Mercuric resistance operon regulatory protein n=1 Tax=mine drainage metagenome TaxID=410659 RepID=A0A1J5QB59_9ZZZZ|nr:Hg(II)-responsive transcriptional regulator [Thiomonas sp.]MDE2129858.1 Hg(II)-responsive transcriptional regulator [Betaproteobacteria bacterium]OZB44490.1 MAG: Hg(II)-responsive transcriptional regulator [Thiomonas sp. 15-66-11]